MRQFRLLTDGVIHPVTEKAMTGNEQTVSIEGWSGRGDLNARPPAPKGAKWLQGFHRFSRNPNIYNKPGNLLSLKSKPSRSNRSAELGVHRRLLYKWRDQLEPIDDGQGPPENSKERELRQQVAQLKRLVADKTLEADFFKTALQKVEARRQGNKQAGETASTTKSGS